MVKAVGVITLMLALAPSLTGNAAVAATAIIKVNAKATKPLTLTSVQDLSLGTIVLAPGTWSGATVSISRAGVFSCSNANISCTGATQVATYSVSGSNNEVVKVTAPNVTLTNQADPTQKLVLVVDGPGTVTLANASKKGTDFSLGGSVTLNSATTGGLYAGTFDVTVEYN
jgi:hypothetical protein